VQAPAVVQPPPAPKPVAQTPPKSRPKKKAEPEVELKPVEPKIIHP
jgi:hypothetical protein